MKKVITLLMAALSSANLVAQNENLQPGDKVTITNPTFENGNSGWTRTSGSLSYSSSYSYGYSSSGTFDFNQTITDLPSGIYMLKVSAYDQIAYYTSSIESSYNPAASLNTYIYVNGTESSVKSILDDKVSSNIYPDSYIETKDGYYIPNSGQSIHYAFNWGQYENYVPGVVTDGTLKIGISHRDANRSTYVYFSNFEVTYVSSDTDLEAYAAALLEKPMSSDVKSALQNAQTVLTSAKGTGVEATALTLFYDKLGKAETSVQTYAKLGDFLKTLSATSLPKNIWPQTIADAEAVARKYAAAYQNNTLTDNDIINALVLADDFKERINYTYLNIAVTTPGAMGDSILAKVENFSDVQSLKLSGKLNSEDISTLKSRLTSLRELDLSDLDWTDIPVEQFRDKTELRRVVLPNNVATIGNYAFYNCQKLQEMEFPASLRSIGNGAFYQTYSIGAVVLPEGLVSLGNECFEYSRLTSVALPSTLKTIPYQSFYDCEYLREISFNGQTDIKENAFYSCRRLSSVKFPETLKTIAYYAFSYCYALRDIEFNEGLTQIAHYAFGNCDSLKAVTLPSSLQSLYDNNYYYSSSATFYDCDNLTQITCNAIVPPYVNSGNITNKSGLDLYVPLLSVNVYKQATGWDQFNIHGINVMPENIVVNSDYKLNWPDSLNFDYKPNVTITDSYNTQYGSLTVTGNSTLSAKQFTMKYDPNITYDNYDWDSERQEYYRNRFAYTSLVNEATVRADNVTLELWLRANSWEFLTVPYDIKVSDIRLAFEGTPFVIRKYDGGKRAAGMTGATWVEMTADSTLHAGEGYIWRSASTDNNRNYTGFYLDALQTVNKNNIFANSDLEIPLANYESEFEHNRSWNLIGNPYPCFYDIRAMRTSAPITVWDTYQNNYRAYSPEDDSYILNPGQAFFVQRPVDEESIVFLKEGRQKNLTVRDIEYGGSSSAKSLRGAKAQRSVFNVRLNNGEQGDFTRFVINPEATLQYDAARDASKFMSIEKPAAQLYTVEGDVRYAINERPLSDGNIILGMQIATEGLYTITLDTKADAEVYLVDNLLGQEVRMDGNTEGYAFQSAAGTFESRFSIRIGGKATGIETVENSEASASSGLYDLQGRRVSELQKGVYLKSGKKVIVK